MRVVKTADHARSVRKVAKESVAELLDGRTDDRSIKAARYTRDALDGLCDLAVTAMKAIEDAESAIASEIVVRFERVRDLVPYGSCGAVHDQSGYSLHAEFVSIALDDDPLPASGRVRVAADDDQWVWCRYRLRSVSGGEASYEIEIDD